MGKPQDPARGNTREGVFQRHVVPELPVLLRVARRLAGSNAAAEDLVQETLIRAYRAADRFDGRHPRAWLLTILRNTWKSMNRRRTLPLFDDADNLLARVPSPGPDGRSGAEELVVDRSLDHRLVTVLAGLPVRQRAVVLLVDLDGLTYEEAAQVLDIPAGTVMSRLHRARRRLRRRLEEQGF